MKRVRIAIGLALLVGLGHATVARADEAPGDAASALETRGLEARASGRDLAAAEALYEAGKQLLVSGACESAIERLEASQALDPAVGTLLNLAECYVALGRMTSAWSTYRDAASLAVSTKQRSKVAPESPTLAESGVPGFDATAWFGLFAPHGTPPELEVWVVRRAG